MAARRVQARMYTVALVIERLRAYMELAGVGTTGTQGMDMAN